MEFFWPLPNLQIVMPYGDETSGRQDGDRAPRTESTSQPHGDRCPYQTPTWRKSERVIK
jgi:hypothetical protein